MIYQHKFFNEHVVCHLYYCSVFPSNHTLSADSINSLVWLLLILFIYAGSELLIRELPSILDGSARVKAQPQDDSKATLAPKVDFSESHVLVLEMDKNSP